MKDMASLFPMGRSRKLPRSSAGAILIVTETTGTLCSNVLVKLLQDNAVMIIYAFNRPSTNGESS